MKTFANIFQDIALLNSLGVRLVLVHGSRPQIAQRLERAALATSFHDGMRITDTATLEHVKGRRRLRAGPGGSAAVHGTA